jgi:hypothetical protein
MLFTETFYRAICVLEFVTAIILGIEVPNTGIIITLFVIGGFSTLILAEILEALISIESELRKKPLFPRD